MASLVAATTTTPTSTCSSPSLAALHAAVLDLAGLLTRPLVTCRSALAATIDRHAHGAPASVAVKPHHHHHHSAQHHHQAASCGDDDGDDGNDDGNGRGRARDTHAEDDFEGLNFAQHMVAGATAGIAEHVAMFPVDTVKTRMQALGHPGQQLRSGAGAVGLGGRAPPTSLFAQQLRSVPRALRSILKREGARGLYSGVGAVAAGAGPAHALYFASYEAAKEAFEKLAVGGMVGTGGGRGGGRDSSGGVGGDESSSSAAATATAAAAAGAVATLASDALMTPADVVKQRLQVAGSPYSGVVDCVRTVVATEGAGAFFRSLRTTLVMNVPFTALHFAGYETAKKALSPVLKPSTASAHGGGGGGGGTRRKSPQTPPHPHDNVHYAPPDSSPSSSSSDSFDGDDDDDDDGLLVQLTAGGAAGGLAAAATTPLDVVKTRLQLEGVGSAARYGSTRVFPVMRKIAADEGGAALWAGLAPRVLFHVPAAAVCWGTYETCKRVMKRKQ